MFSRGKQERAVNPRTNTEDVSKRRWGKEMVGQFNMQTS